MREPCADAGIAATANKKNETLRNTAGMGVSSAEKRV
jgi:hypothetical protein